jgi:hypothetical protein
MVVLRRDFKRGSMLINLCVNADSFFHHESLKHPDETFVICRVLMPRVCRRNFGNQTFAEFVPIVEASFAEPNCHSEEAAFPWFVENRFPVASRDSRGTVRLGGDALGQIATDKTRSIEGNGIENSVPIAQPVAS